ncbi:hypothetical protein ACFQY7_48295 [Actinomadura luteofluorescens]
MNTAKQVGGALGLASLTAATAGHTTAPASLANAYGNAFLLMALMLPAIAAVSLALPSRRDTAEPPRPEDV